MDAACSSGSGPVTALVGYAGYPWELWRPSADAVNTEPSPIRRPEAMSIHSTPGSTLAVLVRGNALEVWDIARRAVIGRANCSAVYSTESALVRTADGYLVAVGGDDGRVRVYDLPDAAPLSLFGQIESTEGSMADSVEVSTSQLVIELVVATAFVVYFALIAGNYRGIMDFFLRQTERNRRFMRRLVGAPVDRTAPLLPPHHELGRKVWKFGFGFLAISGTVFVIVRVVSLVDRLL